LTEFCASPDAIGGSRLEASALGSIAQTTSALSCFAFNPGISIPKGSNVSCHDQSFGRRPCFDLWPNDEYSSDFTVEYLLLLDLRFADDEIEERSPERRNGLGGKWRPNEEGTKLPLWAQTSPGRIDSTFSNGRPENRLRHPKFVALRDDRDACKIIRERL
jgi:hypothetical protein